MRAAKKTSSGWRWRTRAPTHCGSTGRATIGRQCRALSGAQQLTDIPLAELIEFIDWTPFFATWELNGKFPAILNDPQTW